MMDRSAIKHHCVALGPSNIKKQLTSLTNIQSDCTIIIFLLNCFGSTGTTYKRYLQCLLEQNTFIIKIKHKPHDLCQLTALP
uniref:Uncharacterized protein n=1 Tax=Anguilla anguilla TaxID=7936 RepID=A0A0E9WIT1_ANGAN